MPVDKDVFAFRMRRRNDFACSCSGTKIVHMQIQKNRIFFRVFNNHLRGQMSLMRLSLITRAAAGLLSNGLAE